jgi:hypothetical protein
MVDLCRAMRLILQHRFASRPQQPHVQAGRRTEPCGSNLLAEADRAALALKAVLWAPKGAVRPERRSTAAVELAMPGEHVERANVSRLREHGPAGQRTRATS